MPEAPAAAAAPDAATAAGRTRPDLGSLRWLLPLLLRHPGMLALAGLALVVAAAATVAVPLGVRRIIDLGFAGTSGALVDQYFSTMIALGAVLAAASATRFYCVSWLGERLVADLQSEIFARLVRLGPSFFETARTGDVVSRLTADTGQIRTALVSAISQTLRNLLLLAGSLVMMLLTSVKLTLLVMAAIPVIVLPLIAYGRSVRKLSRAAQDSLGEAAAQAGESLSGIRTVQAFGAEKATAARFSGLVGEAFAAARRRLLARAGLTFVAIVLVFASIIAILWHGAASVLAGNMSAGNLVQFVLFAVFAAGALSELSEVWGEIQQAAGAAGRLSALAAMEPDIRSPDRPQAMPVPARGEIAFENVRFAYPSRPDSPALDGVSFLVRPGETVAVVGPSGAGKSTLFNLILRFHDPLSGHVRIDGVDLAGADLAEVRARAAIVPQDVTLFAASVLDNLRLGTPAADEAAVMAAVQAAGAEDLVRSLPEGLATRVGERGMTLSGGQRQRLAIARALLRQAPILLLDEATSALDAESEAAIQKALEAMRGSRTTLVIAHRLATVQRADRILVLDAGRIVGEGTHASLVRAGGLYARLAELQFRSEPA